MPLPQPTIQYDPQQSGPLDQYAKAVSLRDMLQRGQVQQEQLKAAQLENQQRETALRDQQTVMQVLGQNNGDIGAALPQLAGKVTPQTYMGLAKAHAETREAALKMSNEELANDAKRNDNLLGLIDQAKQMPPDQYVQAWPQIVQQAVQIKPEIGAHLDPKQPVPQQALDQFQIGLQSHSVIQAQVMKEREDKRAQQTADFAAQKQPLEMQKLQEEAAHAGKVPGTDVPYSPEVFAQKKALKPNMGLMTQNDAKDIADSIENGDQPPTLQGLYRNAGPVRAELARRGVPLAKMETDWKATQKYMSTLNGSQQVRLRQAVETASESLDKIDDLYKQLQAAAPTGGFKTWNKAVLAGAKQLPGKAGSLATNLEAQIADVTSELGNVYMGGNSPTDHALGLAGKQLSGDWNAQTFNDAIQQARANLRIRQNSITHGAPAGVSGDNAYFQQPPAQSGGGGGGGSDPFAQFGGKPR